MHVLVRPLMEIFQATAWIKLGNDNMCNVLSC